VVFDEHNDEDYQAFRKATEQVDGRPRRAAPTVVLDHATSLKALDEDQL